MSGFFSSGLSLTRAKVGAPGARVTPDAAAEALKKQIAVIQSQIAATMVGSPLQVAQNTAVRINLQAQLAQLKTQLANVPGYGG